MTEAAIETAIEIRTADGVVTGFVYKRDAPQRLPGVIHLTDIGGIRPAHREMARRLANEGFTVLLPNVFYRTREPPMFDFPMQWGEERTMKRFAELAGPMTPDAIARDATAYVDFLLRQSYVSGSQVGVVGYCYTGGMSLRTAAVCAKRVAAAASFHGGNLRTDAPNSPHLGLPEVSAELYFGHAIEDRSMPAEAITKLGDALATWGGRYQNETYDGARHGWTVPGSPVYHKDQAENAFVKLTDLLNRTLRR
jgi:carboxymethylenebutenolidase